MKAHICIVGMATLDSILVVGQTQGASAAPRTVSEFVECPGGKGFVAAVAAARAGAFVDLWAYTGLDWPTPYEPAANAINMKSELCVAATSNRTWNLIQDGVDVQTAVYEAALNTTNVSYSGLRDELLSADCVVLTTERPSLTRFALSTLQKRPSETIVVANPNLATLSDYKYDDELLTRTIRNSDFLIMNAAEEMELRSRLNLPSWTQIDSSSAAVNVRGLVVTNGEYGYAFAHRPFAEWTARPAHRLKGPVRCTLGAGDTFLGTACTLLAVGASLEIACDHGARAAAQKVEMLSSALMA